MPLTHVLGDPTTFIVNAAIVMGLAFTLLAGWPEVFPNSAGLIHREPPKSRSRRVID